MTYTIRTECRICDGPLPPPFLSLGMQPLANNLCTTAEEQAPLYPLALTRCPRCGLTQLTGVVDPAVLFGEYLYTPSQSATFRKHFADMAASLIRDLCLYADAYADSLVVDIGSNDGLLLSSFKQAGHRVVGVEPAGNLARQANADGITTIQDFWGEGVAQGIRAVRGPAGLITATNVFAHCDDLHGFLDGVNALLAPDGVFVLEVPSLPVMLRDGTFDLIYHEHLSYFEARPLLELFGRHGLRIFRVDDVPIHGGSFRVYAERAEGGLRAAVSSYDAYLLHDHEFSAFTTHARETRWHFTAAVRSRKSVAGYGAPAKATVLLNYCGLTKDDIAYVVDDSPLKQGRFIPGAGIPIVSRQYAEQHPVETMVIFPWNVAEDILPKLNGIAREALVPMPTLRELPVAEPVTA